RTQRGNVFHLVQQQRVVRCYRTTSRSAPVLALVLHASPLDTGSEHGRGSTASERVADGNAGPAGISVQRIVGAAGRLHRWWRLHSECVANVSGNAVQGCRNAAAVPHGMSQHGADLVLRRALVSATQNVRCRRRVGNHVLIGESNHTVMCGYVHTPMGPAYP